MKAIVLFLVSTSALFAQTAPEKSPVTYRLLYVDRPPTAKEVAAAESSGIPLEPTVYYLAAPESGQKQKTEFLPLSMPFARLTSSVSLPAGMPLSLYSKPDPALKIADILPGEKTQIIAVLSASRDKAFHDAKVQILDASAGGFPFGQMRIINASDRKVAVKTLDPLKTLEPGGVVTFQPKPGRRDTVPVIAGIEENGKWREIHSGAAKVRGDNRVLLLVSGATSMTGRASYSIEYLSETTPKAPSQQPR
jgi:hypothetical protein